MKKLSCPFFAVVMVILTLTSCAAVISYEPLRPQNGMVCPTVFPEKAFRAVHRIEMESARIGKSIFIGAVKCEPDKDALHAVLMSIEGMVLFEAEVKKGDLRIINAVSPLNDPAFARGLMADVSFLLLKPAGTPIETGTDEEGMAACRWTTANGGVFEQTLMRNGAIRIRIYNSAKRLNREALAMPPFDRGLPAEMRLTVYGPAKYFIDLKLLNSIF